MKYVYTKGGVVGVHNIGISGFVPQWILQQGRALLLIYGSQCKATDLYHPTEDKLENDLRSKFIVSE